MAYLNRASAVVGMGPAAGSRNRPGGLSLAGRVALGEQEVKEKEAQELSSSGEID